MSTETERRGAPAGPWDDSALAEREPFRELIAEGELRAVGVRPSIGAYLRDIWARRHFLVYDARSRVLTKNSKHRLGSVWLVGKPVLDAAFFFVIFGLVLQIDRGIENYPGFIIIGVLLFRYTANSMTQSASLMHSNRAMIHAFSFPRASLVISLALRELFAVVPLLAAVFVMLMIIPPHEFPSLSWLMVLPLVPLQALMNLGVSFIVARIGVSLPDISFGFNFLSRVLMYGSGVIFPIERFISHPAIYEVMTNNPLFILLNMYRTMLLDHTVPPLGDWLTIAAWGAGLTVVGFLMFWKAEERYGRH
ncbi:ABC transporter permease [Rothia sp. AR01]|uniref:Transport permease protein n=1 Tax=Rothia santali TaxID=2949643 RepID=A0A9X2HI88_9MICC|nr:ABC transporter permease [Rothia santali]MCP3426196.1 ABC transporter permease [Rothia santali]